MKKLILALVLLPTWYGNAQNTVTIQGLISSPTKQFGAGTEYYGSVAYASYAGTGIGIGVQYQKPVGEFGLNFFGQINVIRNSVKRSYRKEYNAELVSNGTTTETMNHSEYYNAPISVGLLYERNIEDNIGLYVQGGVLLNVFKISKSLYTETWNSEQTKTIERTYSGSTSVGIMGEIGVTLRDKINIGIGYSVLGKHSLSYTRTTIYPFDTDTDSSDIEKAISMMTLKVGFRL